MEYSGGLVMKRTSIPVEDAIDLLDAYDGWVGSLHPDDREEYLARFDRLRNRLEKYRNEVDEDE
jgi:hypothetical protein